MSILVVGSFALDTIETPFDRREETLGGSSVYISLSASYFHPKINLVAVAGSDCPQEYFQLLSERGIDLDGLEIIENGKTFRWTGRYHTDMNIRDTLKTELNVFEHFDPKIPELYKSPRIVMLGNIDPVLQNNVLNQINPPKLVVLDTMNYWIEGKLPELLETLKKVDVLIINDSEAKLLSNESSLIKASKKILKLGPSKLIIKKGEHGALLISNDFVFCAPAFPLEEVNDPTGAGDTFAGGFVGYLAKTGTFDDESFKRAVIFGSVMASFCVEKFGVEGLLELNLLKIRDRFTQFVEMTRFEES